MPLTRAQIGFGALQAALVLAIAAGLWLSYPSWRLSAVVDRVHKQHPDVPELTTADLATWLSNPKAVKPVLLDARTQAEYDMSHLAGAHRVDAVGELNEEDLPDDKARAIVVYCSIGDQSSGYAQRLMVAGHTRVFILEGAIVRWANEGRPLTDGHRPTTRVYAVDPEAAGLLKSDHRAPTPTKP